MAKFADDGIMDAALDNLINNADKLVVCAGQPANYSDATTDTGSGGNALGETAIGTGDFTKANGDTSGRKVTVAAQSGISVDVDGTADHVAIIDDTNTTLKLVTTLSSSQSVSAGGTMDTDAFDEEIEDPA
jgi:hypothetical protein